VLAVLNTFHNRDGRCFFHAHISRREESFFVEKERKLKRLYRHNLYDTLGDTSIADEREDRFGQESAVQSRKKDV
jgi:hypothetical protein